MKKFIGYLILICISGYMILKLLDIIVVKHGHNLMAMLGFFMFLSVMSLGFYLIKDKKNDF